MNEHKTHELHRGFSTFFRKLRRQQARARASCIAAGGSVCSSGWASLAATLASGDGDDDESNGQVDESYIRTLESVSSSSVCVCVCAVIFGADDEAVKGYKLLPRCGAPRSN